MTVPRQVLPGTTYLVTRRCAQRQFLLRPSRLTNQIFGYVLAVAARRFGVRVHAFCVLSNHFHLVLTDPTARLPAFEQYLDSLVARALNAALGRWESFWSPQSYSAVALVCPQDVVDKAAYVLANPVAAGLVRRGLDWTGLRSTPGQIGSEPLEFRRPEHFFRPAGVMPEVERLPLVAPASFATDQAFRDAVDAALAEREALARAERQGGGRWRTGRARAAVPSPGEPRRQLNPRVACRDKWKRVEALARLVGFIQAYRRARRALCAGVARVLFPAGTYQLRVTQGVACEGVG